MRLIKDIKRMLDSDADQVLDAKDTDDAVIDVLFNYGMNNERIWDEYRGDLLRYDKKAYKKIEKLMGDLIQNVIDESAEEWLSEKKYL